MAHRVGYPLGEPFFPVCGWLCGQIQIQKFKVVEKMLKYKKNPAFPTGKTGLSGAAGRIRTADLILTKDALYLLSYSSINGDPERARTVDL